MRNSNSLCCHHKYYNNYNYDSSESSQERELLESYFSPLSGHKNRGKMQKIQLLAQEDDNPIEQDDLHEQSQTKYKITPDLILEERRKNDPSMSGQSNNPNRMKLDMTLSGQKHNTPNSKHKHSNQSGNEFGSPHQQLNLDPGRQRNKSRYRNNNNTGNINNNSSNIAVRQKTRQLQGLPNRQFSIFYTVYFISLFISKLKSTIVNNIQISSLTKFQFRFISDKATTFKASKQGGAKGDHKPGSTHLIEFIRRSFKWTKKTQFRNCLKKIQSSYSSCKYGILRCQRRVRQFLTRLLNLLPSFHPYNTFYLIWEVLIDTLNIAMFSLIPFVQSFSEYENYYEKAIFYYRIIFTVNVFVRMNTSIFLKGILVKDHLQILKHYVSSELVIDVVHLTAIYSSNAHMRYFYFVKLLNFGQSLKKIQQLVILNNQLNGLIEVSVLLLKLIFVAHIFAIIWYELGQLQHSRQQINWMSQLQLDTSQPMTLYINSLYFSLVTIQTIGYGDIHAYSNQEKLLIVIMTPLCSLMYGYMINKVGIILHGMAYRRQQLDQQIAEANNFMKSHNVDKLLQNKVRQYIVYAFEEGLQNKNSINSIKSISHYLQEEVLRNIYSSALMKVAVIRENFSRKFIEKLCLRMRESSYGINEIIQMQARQQQPAISFVAKGSVEIYLEHGSTHRHQPFIKTVKQLEEGEFFGQDTFFQNQWQNQFSVRSRSITRIYSISISDFLEVLQEFPQDREIFCMMKERVVFNQENNLIKNRCYSCGQTVHCLFNCPYIFYGTNKQKLLRKIQSNEKKERKSFARRDRPKFHTMRMNQVMVKKQQSFIQINYSLIFENNSEDSDTQYSQFEEITQQTTYYNNGEDSKGQLESQGQIDSVTNNPSSNKLKQRTSYLHQDSWNNSGSKLSSDDPQLSEYNQREARVSQNSQNQYPSNLSIDNVIHQQNQQMLAMKKGQPMDTSQGTENGLFESEKLAEKQNSNSNLDIVLSLNQIQNTDKHLSYLKNSSSDPKLSSSKNISRSSKKQQSNTSIQQAINQQIKHQQKKRKQTYLDTKIYKKSKSNYSQSQPTKHLDEEAIMKVMRKFLQKVKSKEHHDNDNHNNYRPSDVMDDFDRVCNYALFQIHNNITTIEQIIKQKVDQYLQNKVRSYTHSTIQNNWRPIQTLPFYYMSKIPKLQLLCNEELIKRFYPENNILRLIKSQQKVSSVVTAKPARRIYSVDIRNQLSPLGSQNRYDDSSDEV